MAAAVGASFNIRVGEPPMSTRPPEYARTLGSIRIPNPSGSRAWRISRSYAGRRPLAGHAGNKTREHAGNSPSATRGRPCGSLEPPIVARFPPGKCLGDCVDEYAEELHPLRRRSARRVTEHAVGRHGDHTAFA